MCTNSLRVLVLLICVDGSHCAQELVECLLQRRNWQLGEPRLLGQHARARPDGILWHWQQVRRRTRSDAASQHRI